MWNLITLDGYFEGPAPGDLDWHNEVWGDDFGRAVPHRRLELLEAKPLDSGAVLLRYAPAPATGG